MRQAMMARRKTLPMKWRPMHWPRDPRSMAPARRAGGLFPNRVRQVCRATALRAVRRSTPTDAGDAQMAFRLKR
jgi:hypothetical protein